MIAESQKDQTTLEERVRCAFVDGCAPAAPGQIAQEEEAYNSALAASAADDNDAMFEDANTTGDGEGLKQYKKNHGHGRWRRKATPEHSSRGATNVALGHPRALARALQWDVGGDGTATSPPCRPKQQRTRRPQLSK